MGIIKTVHDRYIATRASAKARGYSFELTETQYANLFSWGCFYCKQPATGLDRLNPRVGYEVPNVVACCGDCNQIKGKMHYSTWAKWLNRFLPLKQKLPENYDAAKRFSEAMSERRKVN